jgi:hypothetical protein
MQTMKLKLILLVVPFLFSCEEDEIGSAPPAPPISIANGYFVARAGEDRSVLTGDTVILKATFANNQRNNSFRWRFISKPANSQVEIDNPEQSEISFKTDQPGIYQLELGMFFDQFSAFDTIRVSAFTIKKLEGSYSNPQNGANGIIRQFQVYQDKLYAAGDFTKIGGIDAHGLAIYDGKQWSGLCEELQVDQVYQLVEYQDKIFVSGSSREAGRDGVRKFAFWNGKKWQTLGFAADGSHMDVYQGVLFLNFGNRLGRWDGSSLTFPQVPFVETITFLKTMNGQLYLRGYGGASCENSTENIWVYNCGATGYLLQYDGLNWKESGIYGENACLNIGRINWSYHIWINSEPDFGWNVMTGYEDRVYFYCGYSDGGTLKEFSYPFEKIYTMQIIGDGELYLSGRNQKTGDYTGIMKWDGQQWYTLGNGVDGQIMAMAQYQGKLYIGGSFSRSLGESPTNFSVWEGP